MGFRPQPDIEATLIRFKQGDAASYKVYTDHLQAFLDQYKNDKQTSENLGGCTEGKKDDQTVCRFELDTLGTECTWQKDFGYDEGQPCVLLKLNKVYGWEPESYPDSMNSTDAELPEGFPASGAAGMFNGKNVIVTCEGENPADQENIGPIKFMPTEHFDNMYFPYLNQEGYRSPVVMAQFTKPSNGVLIQVWCKAWAKNIMHHRNDKAGSIHFELLVD